MRIIVDTSVWSLALIRQSATKNKESLELKSLIEDGEEIYLLGIILQELLQGIRKKETLDSLSSHLNHFPIIEPTREDYVEAAELKNTLMKKGIQVSTVDALIAHVAIAYNCLLFTTDRDFQYIEKYTELKLLRY
jgi:hypothetical protein